jgi:Virulence-associated protein E
MNLEHRKNDISSTVESYRPLWSQDLYERPRWFYSIGTTNKDQYNYDTINRRYYGMKVAVDGKMLDNQRFITNHHKIMGALVWNVRNGMSGAISKDIANDARYHQDIRIVDNDLMMILKRLIAFAHVDKDIIPSDVKIATIIERYQIGYRDIKNDRGTNRTYMIRLTGLSNFASDYTDFWKRKDIKIDLQSLKEAILRLLVEVDIPVDENGNDIADIATYKDNEDKIIYRRIHFKWKFMDKVVWVPTLKRAIRGYSLEIAGPDTAKVEALAMNSVDYLQDFMVAKLGAQRPDGTTNHLKPF